MGTGRLIRFILPSVGMMIFTSIYMVVDGFFVSNFNLIMPLITIFAAVGFIFGTGGSAIVAKTFGEGDKEKANQYFSLFTYVAFVLGVILAVIGIVFIRPIATILGAEGEMLNNACLYARIILLALPFNILQAYFQNFFITTEKPQLGFAVTLSSGVTNMVLDAILLVLLPMLLGIDGIWFSVVVAEVVAVIISAIFVVVKRNKYQYY